MENGKYACLTAYQKRFGDLSESGACEDLAAELVSDFLGRRAEFPGVLEHKSQMILYGKNKRVLDELALRTELNFAQRMVSGIKVLSCTDFDRFPIDRNGSNVYVILVDSYASVPRIAGLIPEKCES